MHIFAVFGWKDKLLNFPGVIIGHIFKKMINFSSCVVAEEASLTTECEKKLPSKQQFVSQN